MHQPPSRESGPWHHAASKGLALRLALIPGALAGFFTIGQVARSAEIPVAFCAVKQLLGVPCPGCGITRSIAALLDGDPAKAIELNAAGPVVVAFFCLQLVLVAAAAAGAAPDSSVLRVARVSDRMLLTALLIVWSKRMVW